MTNVKLSIRSFKNQDGVHFLDVLGCCSCGDQIDCEAASVSVSQFGTSTDDLSVSQMLQNRDRPVEIISQGNEATFWEDSGANHVRRNGIQ
mmetsp:Transcript_1838/g.4785  ORF Transcript_1838/g.4785 Transcript_1838/m.4785 type:complete len:91 (+) Transcript_1838:7-279(+)